MPKYTFAELLRVFYQLRKEYKYEVMDCTPTEGFSQAELAKLIGISMPTLQNWFAGRFTPQRPEAILNLSGILNLTALQSDMLLYAVNPKWIQYGHSTEILEAFDLLCYRPSLMRQEVNRPIAPPSLEEIERDWDFHFIETFQSNINRWGTGTKNNGISLLTKMIHNDSYNLTMENNFHDNVFMSGDSACFAPDIYNIQVDAKLIEGEDLDAGYGISFDEICDEHLKIFRIKPNMNEAKVVGNTHENNWSIYINTSPVDCLMHNTFNRISMTVFNNQYWFYINSKLFGYAEIPRVPHTRLDVAVIVGNNHTMKAEFKNFIVRVPPLEVHE